MAMRRSWADLIFIDDIGDVLAITGTRFLFPFEDLLEVRYARLKSQKGGAPLYLEFARVSSDEELAQTSRLYGAFYGELTHTEFIETERNHDFEQNHPSEKIQVLQNNAETHGEFAALRALLFLIDALGRDTVTAKLDLAGRLKEYGAISEQAFNLARQTSKWDQQLANEHVARKRFGLQPETGWSWTSREQEKINAASSQLSWFSTERSQTSRMAAIFGEQPKPSLRSIITTVLNAFPVQLDWDFKEMRQHTGADLIFGIRPLLYHMIREDLLSEAEIRLCRSKSCGHFFRAQRSDQMCCSPACSERVRSQTYYETKRKPARQASKRRSKAK